MHDRVTVLELSSTIGSIIIINVCLPYFDNSNVASQSELYSDVMGFIDSVIDDNIQSHFILMGDMNCDFYNGSNQFSIILKNFINQRGLYCTFDSISSFDRTKTYTRFNLKQKSFSLLDFLFVSPHFVPYILDITIVDHGDTLSDHLSVKITLDVTIETEQISRPQIQSVIDWKAVDEPTRNRYETVMNECLDKVSIPHILHGDHICNDSLHAIAIDKYYNDLLH